MNNLPKFLILVFILTLISFVSCQNSDKKNDTKPIVENELVDMHNSHNSLDWQGSYSGVLPNSSGHDTGIKITLNEDGTYEQTIDLQAAGEKPAIVKCTFKWSDDKNKIMIDDKSFKVGENKLVLLDAEGKELSGESANSYILKKIELVNADEVNDGVHPAVFVGDDGKEYNVAFDTNTIPPTATIQVDKLKIVLTQTEAWAKGAEYEGKNVSLTASGDNATLILNMKKIKLKIKN